MASTANVVLRGVDPEAVKLAKLEAARRGQPLGRVVGDLVREALSSGSAANEVDAGDVLAADTAWFEKERARLFKKYPGQYVAIVQQRVVDHDRTIGPLVRRVFAKYGMRSILMPKVTREPRVIRLRSPRIVRP